MSITVTQTRTALRLVFFILLLDVIGISILWPVAAFIVRQYSNNALMLTILTALYSCAQFFAAPLMGKLGDIYGRRPVLVISLFGSALGYVLFGIGGALWVLLLSRLIDGITAGNQSVAAAYISDVSTPETRSRNFSLFGIAWGLGLVIGPALGAALGQINLAAPAYFAAALSLGAALMSIFILPESLPSERRSKAALRAADLNPFRSIWLIVRRPALGQLLLVLCLFNFVFNGFNSTESLFLLDKFKAEPWQIGSMVALAGLALVGMQKVLPGLIERFGQQKFGTLCLYLLALASLATYIVPQFGWLYGVVAVRTVAAGFLFPTLGSLMSSYVEPREQGVLMGVNTALTSAMCVFGPLWAGVMYDYVVPSSPYWMGAAILMATAFYLSQMVLQRPAA
ncbi:MAG: MFS transporter [Pseudomonadota bacterium]